MFALKIKDTNNTERNNFVESNEDIVYKAGAGMEMRMQKGLYLLSMDRSVSCAT